ncbi:MULTISPECIES: hypothetical protein [unclassified Streptomyces]|uniref:hypothetical protein n=2 Tax=Streptomyces TaxID=1883 RepID=UPI00131A87F5|nr:hypothetical protein [Streptomyces sp. NRRL S-920]WST00488.1 hypothetical protein OG478_53150 [Streptomyces phaeochromogenes]
MAGTGNKRMLTNRESAYDPASGENWRITVNLPPVVAEALIPKLREIHPRLAAAGLIGAVVEHLVLRGDVPLDWKRTAEMVKKEIEGIEGAQRPSNPAQDAPLPRGSRHGGIST